MQRIKSILGPLVNGKKLWKQKRQGVRNGQEMGKEAPPSEWSTCLLYTSDAADE